MQKCKAFYPWGMALTKLCFGSTFSLTLDGYDCCLKALSYPSFLMFDTVAKSARVPKNGHSLFLITSNFSTWVHSCIVGEKIGHI